MAKSLEQVDPDQRGLYEALRNLAARHGVEVTHVSDEAGRDGIYDSLDGYSCRMGDLNVVENYREGHTTVTIQLARRNWKQSRLFFQEIDEAMDEAGITDGDHRTFGNAPMKIAVIPGSGHEREAVRTHFVEALERIAARPPQKPMTLDDIDPDKLGVYEALKKLAAKHGIDVTATPERTPVEDILDTTPDISHRMGHLRVTQNDGSHPPFIAITGTGKNWFKQAPAFFEEIRAAMNEAGMPIRHFECGYRDPGPMPLMIGLVPENAGERSSTRIRFAQALEHLAAKPGPEAEAPEAVAADHGKSEEIPLCR